MKSINNMQVTTYTLYNGVVINALEIALKDMTGEEIGTCLIGYQNTFSSYLEEEIAKGNLSAINDDDQFYGYIDTGDVPFEQLLSTPEGIQKIKELILDLDAYVDEQDTEDQEEAIASHLSYMATFNNPDEIQIKWCTEDVIMRAIQDEKYLTLQEARDVLGLLNKRHDCNYGISWDTISSVIEEVIGDRNWIAGADKMKVEDFNTVSDAILFLYGILDIERLGGGFHWETPFTDYVRHGILDNTAVQTESYTPQQAAHRQAILDRILDLFDDNDHTIYILCNMVNGLWEYVDQQEAVEVLMRG